MNYITNNFFKDSFIAGLLIGLGCIANLSTNIPVLGPFLFSLGLISVILQKRLLFTGKIGFIEEFEHWIIFLCMLIFNLIGIASICLLFKGQVDASTLCNTKLNETFFQAFSKSIGCGMLMYIAVKGYQKSNQLLSIILPVMMFIICGFDHCIANYGYMILNGEYWCWQLPVWILGNTIGSLIISKI